MTKNKRFFHLLFMNITFIMLLAYMYSLVVKSPILFEMYISNFMMFNISMIMDVRSIVFMTTVSLISYVVMMYSVGYMQGMNENKFMLTMVMFILSMLILSSSANLMWVMIGWDGLGVTSFSLIMFFQNWKSFNSAMVTFMSNRLGDMFIISTIAFLMMNNSFISWMVNVPLIIQLFIVITALSKSAQIPFSTWLPLAMAAPTPVSSLVHSSTLVTAGVFLMLRFNTMFENMTLCVIMFISSFTVILAGVSSLWEFDLKKIIALSTLSHIGLMIMFISIKDEWPAMLHLITHSMFKSLLFMAAGSMIHSGDNIQDIRMINVSNNTTYSIMIISIMSMMGIPFMSGFYSKEMMLMSINSFNNSTFFLIMFFMSIMLTCMYSIRILKYLLMGKNKLMNSYYKENDYMMKSMITGCLLSCAVGSLVMWDFCFVGLFATDFIYNSFMKELLIVLIVLGCFMGLKTLMVNVHNLTLDFSSMLFVSSMSFVYQQFLFKSSFNIMNLDSKGFNDYFISICSSKMVVNTKFLIDYIVNQPLVMNNLMIKVLILSLMVNMLIFYLV